MKLNPTGCPVAAACLLSFSLALIPVRAQTNSGLQVTYGNNGIQQLTFNGVVLEDVARYPSDAFHVWHMKSHDAQGNTVSNGQYGWGENNNGRHWNANSHTWTYPFVWGSIKVQFSQTGDALNMAVTTSNDANSGITFDGANIFPFVLHFPQLPAHFVNASYEQLAFNTTGPSVTLADYGQGEVAAVSLDASKPLYTGFQPAGGGNNYVPIISGTSLDNMAAFYPHNDRPVAPGQTETFTVSLRFGASGTPTAALAADAYKTWAQTWPAQINWPDRRIIGTGYLSSSGQGPVNKPAGFPNNPRRYFNDSNASDFDIRTDTGLAQLQTRVLQQATNTVQNLTKLNAQGLITWDIEGQQYPQDTSYVCSPDQIAQVAPEMESVITSGSSPFRGMKLVDAYFKIVRDAGFRVGVCIRPQQFTLSSNGTAAQVYLPNDQVAPELIRKMRYAHDRWGVTLFYVDSAVQSNGGNLDPAIFQEVAVALPDSLIMPEESTPKYYAYTAPFRTFIFHTDLGTPADIFDFYTHSFSVVLVNDVDPAKLSQYRSQLTESVRHGDILMVHADYWQANDPTVVQMYQDAGVSGPPPPPAPAPNPTPTPKPPPPPSPPPPPPNSAAIILNSPVEAQAVSGTILVNASIGNTLDAAGSYVMVDGKEIGSRRITHPPYVYPVDTAKFTNGQHTVQVWANDTNNDHLLSAKITIIVNN